MTLDRNRKRGSGVSPNGELSRPKNGSYMASYLGLSVGRIVGVMKTTNSRFGLVVLDFDLKSQPRNGMSPRNGTFWMDSTTSCCRMPPFARVTTSGFASDRVLFSASSASRTRLIFNFRPMSPKAMPAGVMPENEPLGETGKLPMFPPAGRPVVPLTGRKLPSVRLGLLEPPWEPRMPGAAGAMPVVG